MNDKYERTETYHDRYEHDIREFKKRIEQLENELEQAQTFSTVLEIANSDLHNEITKLMKTIGKVKQWASEQDYGTANMSYHKAQEAVLQIIRGENDGT